MSAGGTALRYREAQPADGEVLRGWVAASGGGAAEVETWLPAVLDDRDAFLIVAEVGSRPVALVSYRRIDGDVLSVSALHPPQGAATGAVVSALRDTAPRALMRLGARRICASGDPGQAPWLRTLAEAGYAGDAPRDGEGASAGQRWWPDAPHGDWQQGVALFKRHAWVGAGTVADYAERTADHAGISALKNRIERRFVLRHARGRVLDAGCGAGRFTAPLARALPFAVGLDYSADMLAHTGALLAGKGLPRRLVRGDAERLPFRDGSFDSVVSITVLEHFPHYRNMLSEYVRVLGSGGTLVFEMPNALHPRPAGDERDPKTYVSRLDPREASSELASLGLDLVECMPYDFWNQNEVVMRALGLGRRGRRRFQRWLRRALAVPGVARFWVAIERALLQRLPSHVAPNVLLAARKA